MFLKQKQKKNQLLICFKVDNFKICFQTWYINFQEYGFIPFSLFSICVKVSFPGNFEK